MNNHPARTRPGTDRAAPSPLFRWTALALAVLAAGCDGDSDDPSPGTPPSPSEPTGPAIEFTSVPARGTTADLQGRVRNVPANVSVAVYIRILGQWWLRPGPEQPLTSVNAAGHWSCDVTREPNDPQASTFMAFVLPASFGNPPAADGSFYLPEALYNGAIVWKEVNRPEITFSGYRWGVRDTLDQVSGPGPNRYSPSPQNVFVDSAGRLHLRMTPRGNQWDCAEVVLTESLGYGTYEVQVETALDSLHPNVTLGMFVWDDNPAEDHRELDIEAGRWGDPSDTGNTQFVVQPAPLQGHRTRYRTPPEAAPSTHGFQWEPDRVDFASYWGLHEAGRDTNLVIRLWTYLPPGVPRPGRERFHMNFWRFHDITDRSEPMEVVIRRFSFTPLPQ